MSYAIDVDRISPRFSSSIRISAAQGVTVKPFTATVGGFVVIGSTTSSLTCTGTVVYDGGIIFLNVGLFSFTGISGSVASCALLTGTEYAPLEDKYFPMIISMNGTKAAGSMKIATDGTVYFYSDAAGTGWTDSQTGVVYARTVKYDSH